MFASRAERDTSASLACAASALNPPALSPSPAKEVAVASAVACSPTSASSATPRLAAIASPAPVPSAANCTSNASHAAPTASNSAMDSSAPNISTVPIKEAACTLTFAYLLSCLLVVLSLDLFCLIIGFHRYVCLDSPQYWPFHHF